MAPGASLFGGSPVLEARQDAGAEALTTASEYNALRENWKNPSDILSVLLLLAPNIVQVAVAQSTGRLVTPVAFSFGWVAYSAGALMRTFGDGFLMPETDMSSAIVVGAKSGHIRATKTWILGRFLRDEDYRVDRDMKREQSHQHPDAPSCDVQTGPVPSASAGTARPAWEALRITVYRFNENPPVPHGEPTLDRAWYFGIVVIAIELVIAAIPWILYRQSMTFVVAAAGNLLAVVGGSLSQWKVEKWPAPRRCGDTITLTQGNGSRHAVLIVGQKGVGLDMEILARGTRACPPSWDVKAINVVLTLLWICILVTVAGMKENTHYLLIIGLIGSIQNLHAAGSIRTPSSQGIHLIYEQTIRGDRVAKVLRAAEEQYPMVGTSLLSVFFPGGLRAKDPEEIKFWRDAQRLRTARTQHGVRVDLPGSSDDIGSGVEREEELRHKGSEDSQGVQETIVHHDYLATQ